MLEHEHHFLRIRLPVPESVLPLVQLLGLRPRLVQSIEYLG